MDSLDLVIVKMAMQRVLNIWILQKKIDGLN